VKNKNFLERKILKKLFWGDIKNFYENKFIMREKKN
jgi:hypothetical protein